MLIQCILDREFIAIALRKAEIVYNLVFLSAVGLFLVDESGIESQYHDSIRSCWL